MAEETNKLVATEEKMSSMIAMEETKQQASKSNDNGEVYGKPDDVDMSWFRPESDKKRKVYTAMNLTRFGDIINAEQTFRGHFQLDFYWAATYEEKEQWDANGADENNWKPAWIPQPTILRLSNAADVISWEIMLDTKDRDIVLLKQKWGKYTWRRRYIIIAVFSESFELENFPFDIQNFSITIQAVESNKTWEFLPMPIAKEKPFIKVKKRFSPLSEWVLDTCCVEYYASDPAESMSGTQYALITLDVKCIRRWSIYMFNMILPMGILSGLGLTSFAIPLTEGAEGRMGYAINIVFTVVAYQFVVQSQLPNIAYLTYMDYYVVCCFLYSLLLLIQPAIFGSFEFEDIEAVDNVCLIIFAVIFVVQQVWFIVFAKIVSNKEKEKLFKSGSEINYGEGVDPAEYETLKISKQYGRKTEFGNVYFQRAIPEE